MEENLTSDKKEEEIPITQILMAIKSIHFGYVQITVQNSKVVQIDKTEKVRLDGQRLSKPKVSDNG
ncbi:MAG: YezD family protein [Candidatus Jettenia sp.]|nr:YezD family protein [Candidatus Jettenia sp.]